MGSGRATSVEVFGSFPPFPSLSVDVGRIVALGSTTGEVRESVGVGSTTEEESSESVGVGSTTEEESSESVEVGPTGGVGSVPSSVTVIWRGSRHQHPPDCCHELDELFLT